ncbi:MAG: chorismate mutase [Treponema sp.]|jgi:chorismate mutase|nr:chorismate mutase [Treponema sp.]
MSTKNPLAGHTGQAGEPPGREKRLFALRGATQCRNEAEDITREVATLYEELLEKNGLAEEDIVSIFFSLTPDLDALNPAAALRRSGRAGETALFVLQEAAVKDGLERIVRVLIHCYLEAGSVPRHVYRNGAGVLRPDRAG